MKFLCLLKNIWGGIKFASICPNIAISAYRTLCMIFLYLCQKKSFKRGIAFSLICTNMVRLVIQSYPWDSCISSKKAFVEVLNLLPFVLILLYLVIEPYAWDSYTSAKKTFFRRYCICFHLPYYGYVTLCMRFL